MVNGDTPNSELSKVLIAGDHYYKISNYDAMRPFFMNVVSDGNHWLFASSNGGVSIGRQNAESALFPYYTDDKITESAEITGSKTIVHLKKGDETFVWEPFSIRSEDRYRVTRNLYKSIYGNKILFEEVNHDLDLTFNYSWNSSNAFGFVKKSTIINNSEHPVDLSVLDGLQNILPYGVPSDLQNRVSNLVDAYKRSELDRDSGLGIFALSAIIVDKAEPSEALKANIAWSMGLPNPKHLVSSLQLDQFRKGKDIHEESDVKGEKGAYFVQADLTLGEDASKHWMIMANVNQDQSDAAAIAERIKANKDIGKQILNDVEMGTKRLIKLIAASDGLQKTGDDQRDTRHYSNTLFNTMRGGIFDDNYQIEKWDVKDYLSKANKAVFKKFIEDIEILPDVFPLWDLKEFAGNHNDPALRRLCQEYMPLKFSRRHGDPSRPWNRFSINTHDSDGSKILDYEGNWRDIFQNWEALANAYPEFLRSMIYKFLNAMTFDGYNPYRVTKDGFDWETIEPDNPWSYIGYWGDHQIIYLLKFLESTEKHYPGKLESYFEKEDFVYANVPYRIKSYAEILKDPKNTIEFDEELDKDIRQRRETVGADAALMRDEDQSVYTVNFIEKILAIMLAKLSNLIPDGGIWMNTQRPEWNDANNALVGNGVSVVTLCYLRRFLHFFGELLSTSNTERFRVSNELIFSYKRIRKTFEEHEGLLSSEISDADRKKIMDELGQAASDYRAHIYKQAFWGEKRTVSSTGLKRFIGSSLKFVEHSIRANKREDNLYHAYNLMTIEDGGRVSISRLSEMLEGQVAVLSSGYLNSRQALSVLDSLKQSSLFREDQYSYLLYPAKDLPGFTEKNNIPAEAVSGSSLLTKMVEAGNDRVIEKDVLGNYHFNGNFKNAADLKEALELLSDSAYSSLIEGETELVLQIFEDVFDHKAFTGRSGTFFGYEGLGSIYWHMVSKLLLAVQECCLKAIEVGEHEEVIGRLLEHYYEVNEGIGVHKPPSLYGAFPTDPYSHTPAGKGAQQPGMTGQVKEDILCRFGELGVFVIAGTLYFNPCMLRKAEFLKKAETFDYVNVHSQHEQLQLDENSIGFTYCQVPVIYKIAEKKTLEIIRNDGTVTVLRTHTLDKTTSDQLFMRTGDVLRINVHIEEKQLK